MTPEILQQAVAGTDCRAELTAATAHWQNWLTPISADQPTGSDPTYDDDYQSMREEINKISGMDEALLCQLAEDLLISRAKDIRVVSWYLLARTIRDGEKGLADSLVLLCALVETFGDALHPQRPNARKTAFEWLNGERIADALSRWPEVDARDAALTVTALVRLHALTSHADAAHSPSFAGLCTMLHQRLDRSGGASALIPQNSRTAEPQSDVSNPSASLQLTPVRSGRDLLDQSKLLSAWLSEQPAGWLASHRLMKTVRWDTLESIPAMDASSRTRLEPPKADYRAQLKRLYLQQNWIELVEYASQTFTEGVNHFSLDVQWYLWEGLSRAGQPWEGYAAYIVSDLSLLLERLRGLETLAWSDGTPFADEVTLNWINDKVRRDASSFTEVPVTVAGDTDDVLSLESEAMAIGDSDGPEAALLWLQTRPGITSSRSRWLQRLLMARVAEQYGRHDMALHLLAELGDSAPQLTLTEWEPSLMFEVCSRRLKLLRIRASRSESDRVRLVPEMDKLIAVMIQIDPSRALVLCN